MKIIVYKTSFIKHPFPKIKLSRGEMWLKKADIVMKI